jgi:gamma-glutamylcyclotransferase (GGCT)/AIG2-like uncharacterized protein YtfP
MLKRLGAHFEGPRSGILSNGTMGIGMMATLDEIMAALEVAWGDLDDQGRRLIKWGRAAAAADDHREWPRIYRAIDEGVVGVNIVCNDTGDTLLHFAAGGEGEISGSGKVKGVPDLDAAKDLIARGIDVDAVNDYDFSSLHVAMMNDSVEMIEILLDAGADARECVGFMDRIDISAEARLLLTDWGARHHIVAVSEARPSPQGKVPRHLVFFYGSLKRGFTQHSSHKDVSTEFVGEARTRQAMPLIVAEVAGERGPVLVDLQGEGKRVFGEVFRVSDSGLHALDDLMGYYGPSHQDNVRTRKLIVLVLGGESTQALVYVLADATAHIESIRRGEVESISEYSIDMASS